MSRLIFWLSAILGLAVTDQAGVPGQDEPSSKPKIELQLQLPNSQEGSPAEDLVQGIEQGYRQLNLSKYQLQPIEVVYSETNQSSAIIRTPSKSNPMEMDRLVVLLNRFKITKVEKKTSLQLSWKTFSIKEFDRQRLTAPVLVAVMRDLCPGCKAARDKLWSDQQLRKAVVERKMVLFDGNASVDEDIAEAIRKKFDITKLPVVVIGDRKMTENFLIMPGIPKSADVLKAIEKKLPLSKNR